MAFGTQARAQFQRFTQTGQEPVTGQPGSFAVNTEDQKIWTFDPVGAPVRVTRSIGLHDPASAYGPDDIVVTGDTMWLSLGSIPPKPFTTSDWLRLGATSTEVSSNPTASGVYSGGVLSSPGGNTINVSAGSGIIVDPSIPNAATRTIVNWGALSGAITSNGAVIRAITISAAGALGSVSVDSVSTAGRDRIVLGFAFYDAAGNIVSLQNMPRVPAQTAQNLPDLVNAMGGPFRVEGAVLSAAGGMGLNVSQGTVFGLNIRWRNTPQAPNFAQFPQGNGFVFDVIRQNGEIVTASGSAVPSDVYQAGPIPAGFATIHYVFSDPSRSKSWLQLGQQIYPSLTDALLSIEADWATFVTPFNRNSQTVFLGAVVVMRSATDLTDPTQGAVAPTTIGPRSTQRFILQTASIEFLRIDGTSAMQGPLDMNGNAVQNATIDEGLF